jgi:DNA-binding transcriptional ArsR family regulator
VLSGATTVQQVAAIVGLSETTTSSHLKRLRGLGLIDWTYTARNQRGVRILRSCVESVPFNNERGEDTIAIVLASEDGQEFSDAAPLVRPVEPTITNVRELRKGDVLTLEGQDYPVKEVRIGQKAKRAAIRLGIPDGEWWYKPPLDQPITAVRTHEAQRRISQATEARDGMYRYGR